MKIKFLHILFFLISVISFACKEKVKEEPTAFEFDLGKIKERGKIIAITGYNAYSYFIYKGQPMGFEHDLVDKLAEHLGVEVEYKIVKEIDKMIEMLNSGEGDLIAFNLTVTKERKKKIDFSVHHHTTKQVLVQRMPENWQRLRLHEIEKKLIRNVVDLEEKTIHVRHHSSYIERLNNLSNEIGGHINIIEADPNYTLDDMIERVANGEIDFTVADENVALLNKTYFRNIDIDTQISLPQKIAWAVRKNAPKLKSAIDEWLTELKKKTEYYIIYNKYFKNRGTIRKRFRSDFFSYTGGKISEYDDYLKEFSSQINWDWRLTSAVVFQESQFNPNAVSWAGAKGLMQLMPITKKQFGISETAGPIVNLKTGIKYLGWLEDLWAKQIADSTERMKFVLASYNIGYGHIMDASRLAEKYGADPNIWFDNVEKYLQLKSKEKYFNDEVVKNGYARGTETVAYVKEILEIYNHYKQFIVYNSESS